MLIGECMIRKDGDCFMILKAGMQQPGKRKVVGNELRRGSLAKD